MPDELESDIKELDRKITVLHKRMADLRSQATVLETELIGYKIKKEQLKEELRRINLNKRSD